MLDYVVKLTRTPGDVGQEDVKRIKEAGFDDAAVLDICQVAAYYNYVNRLADGLGVELEPYWREDDLSMSEADFERRREDRE